MVCQPNGHDAPVGELLDIVRIHNPQIKKLGDITKVITTSFVDVNKPQIRFRLNYDVATTAILDFNYQYYYVTGAKNGPANLKEIEFYHVDDGNYLPIEELPDGIETVRVVSCTMHRIYVREVFDSVTTLDIRDNANLFDISDMDSLRHLISLHICSNDSLHRLDQLPPTIKDLDIDNNRFLCRIPLNLSFYRRMNSISITNNQVLKTTFLITMGKYVTTFALSGNGYTEYAPAQVDFGSPEV